MAPSPRRLVLTAALAGALATAGVALATPAPGADLGVRIASSAAGASLGLVAGVLIGLLEWAVLRGGTRVIRALEGRLAPLVDPEAPREPVVHLHAAATAALLALGAVALGTRMALVRLRKIQSLELQEELTVVSVVGLLVIAGAIAVALLGLLRRGWAAIDRRVRLPLPRSRPARRILWVGVPVAALGAVGLLLLGPSLGPLASPFAVVGIVGVQVILGALLGWKAKQPSAPPRGARAAALTAAIVLALLIVGIGGAHVAISRWTGVAAALDRSPWPALLARGARAATDVDGDGASSLLGGKDCAPFADRRRPGFADLPGNGVDEDCDGSDATETQAAALPTGARFWEDANGRKRDVVWFVIDALRADHTSALGYERPTTPNLDRLAKESLVFTQAYSQSSATMLSFPSFLTGLDPGRLRWRVARERLQIGENQPTIAERLGEAGWHTGFVAHPYFRDRLPGLLEGWSWVGLAERDQRMNAPSAAAQAATFIARATETKKKKKASPFFLVVYLVAPHTPYVDHGAGYPDFGERPVDLYDGEIVHADRHMGFVLDMLRADEDRWKDTVVVVTGDHGEEFGEHGGRSHSRTCHEESVHVPVVLRAPGEKPGLIEQRVGLIDLVPTTLDLVGQTAPADDLDGHSLLLARHDPDSLPRDRPLFCSVVSQKAAQGSFFRRAVRSGRWLAMRDLRSTEGVVLHDLEHDPREEHPLPMDGATEGVARTLDGWMNLQLTSNLGDVPLGGDAEE